MKTSECFFAAANGYGGFRSNFDNGFSPHKLNKLYILKGGPGTGKSTLMKNVAKRFDDKARVTRIYCSSDVGSLDGVLIERGGTTVGIADGTAPHVIEPRFPGAVEEIVNLGDGFDYRALCGKKHVIMELSKKKSDAYKSAYTALSAAGEIRKCIDGILFNNDIYKEAELYARELVGDIKEYRGAPCNKGFLLSSFSKDGYTYLPSYSTEKKVISIEGDNISAHLIIGEIRKILSEKAVLLRSYESALSPIIFDAVECEEMLFTVSQNGCSTSLAYHKMASDDRYISVKSAHDTMLSLAQKYFKEASEHHFALEAIYSENMSFEGNEAKMERISADIAEIFA